MNTSTENKSIAYYTVNIVNIITAMYVLFMCAIEIFNVYNHIDQRNECFQVIYNVVGLAAVNLMTGILIIIGSILILQQKEMGNKVTKIGFTIFILYRIWTCYIHFNIGQTCEENYSNELINLMEIETISLFAMLGLIVFAMFMSCCCCGGCVIFGLSLFNKAVNDLNNTDESAWNAVHHGSQRVGLNHINSNFVDMHQRMGTNFGHIRKQTDANFTNC